VGGAPVSWGQHRALWLQTWPKQFCASWTISSCSTWAAIIAFGLNTKRETQTVKIQGGRRWEPKVEVAKSMGQGYSSPTLKFMPIHKKKRTNQRRVPTAINDVFSLSLPFWHTTCSHLPQTQDACHHLYFKEHHSKVENNSEPSSWPWYPVWFGYYPLDLSFHTIQGRELNELENH